MTIDPKRRREMIEEMYAFAEAYSFAAAYAAVGDMETAKFFDAAVRGPWSPAEKAWYIERAGESARACAALPRIASAG